MKLLRKYSTISALLVLLTASVASQASVVDSGFKTGPFADNGDITLLSGLYSLELNVTAFDLPAGPFLFSLTGENDPTHPLKVIVASEGFASKLFTLATGKYHWLVGGNAGAIGSVFAASVNAAPVPLPSSVIMIGSALAAMVSIGRRGASRRGRA